MSKQLDFLVMAVGLCEELNALCEIGFNVISIHRDSILLDEEIFDKVFRKDTCLRTEVSSGGVVYTASLGNVRVEAVHLKENKCPVSAPTDTEQEEGRMDELPPDIIAHPDEESKGDPA